MAPPPPPPLLEGVEGFGVGVVGVDAEGALIVNMLDAELFVVSVSTAVATTLTLAFAT